MAIGGGALLSAGASYAGSKKQSGAAKDAANLQMQQFQLLNQQQQPFIQSGYGAMGKLNTLLGLNPRQQPKMSAPMSASGMPSASGPMGNMMLRLMQQRGAQQGQQYMPTPGGGVQPIMQVAPQGRMMYAGGPGGDPYMGGGNLRLRQILALRAQHGDTQAGRFLGMQ